MLIQFHEQFIEIYKNYSIKYDKKVLERIHMQD
jgi:hypothetical protein